MSMTLACIGGASVHRFVQTGQIAAKELPPRRTPWGASEPIYLVESAPAPFYVMSRYPAARPRPAPSKLNYRANLYALRDVGVQALLCWSAAGAITHNLDVGQIVVPEDVIDMTHQRPRSFFENSELASLRQFPVFCPALRQALAETLRQMSLPCHCSGTAAVVEGPRLETPAEVRMLGAVGAEIVTHALAPGVFLAKELQMCFAGACYLVNYAETGSRHRPFTTGELFGGLTQRSQAQRLQSVTGALPELLKCLAQQLASAEKACECDRTLQRHVGGGLNPDWRKWFDSQDPAAAP